MERDIAAVAETCREGGALSKVIIEAALLTDEEKITACTLRRQLPVWRVRAKQASTAAGPLAVGSSELLG